MKDIIENSSFLESAQPNVIRMQTTNSNIITIVSENATQFSTNNSKKFVQPVIEESTTLSTDLIFDINPEFFLSRAKKKKISALITQYRKIFSKHKYNLGKVKTDPIILNFLSNEIINTYTKL